MEKLTTEQIKELVRKWDLELYKKGFVSHRGSKMSNDVRDMIMEHKVDILAYLKKEQAKKDAAAKAAKEIAAKRKAAFLAIPGVIEILETSRKIREDREAFDAAWRRGDGRYPKTSGVTLADLEELKEKYPEAVFAIEMSHYSHRANDELFAIEKRAYEALCDGTPFNEVKAAYDREHTDFVQSHAWD